jgi:hypothetical protein
VPDKFTMIFTPQGRPFGLCEVVWRGGHQMGVTFDTKEPIQRIYVKHAVTEPEA